MPSFAGRVSKLHNTANNYFDLGEYEKAEKFLAEALEMARGAKSTNPVLAQIYATPVYFRHKGSQYKTTAASPGGDGRNDYFGVSAGPEWRLVRRLAVFDRWGDTVFEARDFPPDAVSGRWDGRVRGQAVNPGVFAWLCVMELADGTVETLSGDVTVVR
ncbi:MAG: gliding motility-associated C-terminal domain-containing protein [Thermoanaerobaculia bacterium]|nr:gliding motility-associated C-terminal domain-containing protein [Thermoanaerobaculia bacterium]